MIATDIDPDDHVLFVKDNDNRYRKLMQNSVTLLQMLNSVTEDTISPITREEDPTKAVTPKTPGFPIGVSCGAIGYVKAKKAYRFKEWTVWAHRSVLWNFEMPSYARESRDNTTMKFRSNIRPMGSWIQYLSSLRKSSEADETAVFSEEYLKHAVLQFDSNATILYEKFNETEFRAYVEQDLAPMCFGGVFATQWGQLSSEDSAVTPHGWKVIVDALSREDNIEEGHYMERWWFDLLSWSSYSRSRGNATMTKSINEKGRLPRTILSDSETYKFFGRKFIHWPHKSVYSGLVLLEGPKYPRYKLRFS